jgi:DNA end-binding protein Ku
MARPIWTGSISFGLVTIPVKAYTAVRDHDVHFHRLDKKSGQRVRNRMVTEGSGKEVDTDDLEMGFEVSSGKYVTFDNDELDALRPASTRTIDVTDFVALEEIDPIYYERTYWLGPDGDAAKRAYQLLYAAMDDQKRVGIGTVVMRNKQYLTAIRPLDSVLAMSTMRFADEVVPRADIEEPPKRAVKVDHKALEMATRLVEGLASDWNPKQYHDTYTEELRKRITKKGKGKAAPTEDEEERPASSNVVDLMAALEASIDSAKGRKPRPRKQSRKGA